MFTQIAVVVLGCSSYATAHRPQCSLAGEADYRNATYKCPLGDETACQLICQNAMLPNDTQFDFGSRKISEFCSASANEAPENIQGCVSWPDHSSTGEKVFLPRSAFCYMGIYSVFKDNVTFEMCKEKRRAPFACRSNGPPWPFYFQCDGAAQCDGGHDEEGCKPCEKNFNVLYHPDWVCDNIADCCDGTDEPESCNHRGPILSDHCEHAAFNAYAFNPYGPKDIATDWLRKHSNKK
jgi:hypothetical protein